MDKIDLEEIVTLVCESISKNKRFSELSHIELCDLWKGICKYLAQSINLHGIGSFFSKKSKRVTGDTGIIWSLHFSPSKAWDKLPGYQIDRTVVVGTGAAEPLNLAAVAATVGFSRELVESGVKDIVNGLTRAIRQGSVISLTMGSLGKLVFQNNDVKFRFISNFIRVLDDNSIKQRKLLEKQTEAPPKKDDAQATTASIIDTIAPEAEKSEPALVLSDSCPLPSVPIESKPIQNGNKVTLAPINEKSLAGDVEQETKFLTYDLDAAATKLQNLEDLIDKTFSKESRSDSMHTHFYSGNRLWKNNKCPICKTEAMKNVVDLEAIKKAEKENDKMLLHISLEIDKEYLDKKKEREMKRHQNSVEAAQYNHKVSVESQEKLGFKEKQPMGDLFEKRKMQRPIMSPGQMAAGIHEQILAKRERNERSANIHAMQDRLVCEKLKKEIKAAELQAHLNKAQKSQQMHASLAEQIRINKTLKEKEDVDPTDNPFARSESLMALYQREKAKQLYYEQLAIVRQKHDYANKISDIDKRHSLTRLDIARQELQKDLKTIKKEKFEVRRSLESYWKDQLHLKEHLQKQLDLD